MEDQEKSKLMELISEGKIQKVINNLMLIEMADSRKKEALTIAARYKKLKQGGRLGILSFENINITENQIISSLIELINSPDDQVFPEEKSIKTLHPIKPILWKYITVIAVVIGLLGSIGEVLSFIRIFPSESFDEKLQLTVFVTDTKGNVVLENEGRLNIPIGNRSLNEIIGANGRTNFPDITADNLGDTISIGLDAEGWEIVGGSNTFVFTGRPLHLKVKKDASLGIIKGVVKSRDGQEFIEGAKVLINTDTTVITDSLGVFKIVLPEGMRVNKETDSYLLTVSKKGYKTKTQYHYPKSSDAEIRLEK